MTDADLAAIMARTKEQFDAAVAEAGNAGDIFTTGE